MSFFGFQQQGRGHPTQAPGFGTAPDPFASISQNRHDEGDAYAIAFPNAMNELIVFNQQY